MYAYMYICMYVYIHIYKYIHIYIYIYISSVVKKWCVMSCCSFASPVVSMSRYTTSMCRARPDTCDTAPRKRLPAPCIYLLFLRSVPVYRARPAGAKRCSLRARATRRWRACSNRCCSCRGRGSPGYTRP